MARCAAATDLYCSTFSALQQAAKAPARPPAGWPTGRVRYVLIRRTGRSILRTDAPEEELAREVGDRDRVVVREGEASIRAARALVIPLTLSTRRPLQQQHRTFGATHGYSEVLTVTIGANGYPAVLDPL